MARTGRPSAEQLRRDLGTALHALVKQSSSARRAAADARSQQKPHLTLTGSGFAGKHGVSEEHATMSTAAVDRFTTGHSRASTHVLPCRITQHGRQSAQPQVALTRSSGLAANTAIQHSPAQVLARQQYSVTPPSTWDSIDGLQCEVVVSKKTYEHYGQAPPSKEISGGLLTANLQAAKDEEAVRARAMSPSSSGTDREVLYEKVAQRLDEIAAEINSKYFPEHGDHPAQRQLSSAISEIVQEVSTTSFNDAVSRVIPSTQPEMQQLALLYQLTAAAIHVVGTGSSHASRLADLCVHYAFDKFAAFIMAKGGLDLAIVDSDFEVD